MVNIVYITRFRVHVNEQLKLQIHRSERFELLTKRVASFGENPLNCVSTLQIKRDAYVRNHVTVQLSIIQSLFSKRKLPRFTICWIDLGGINSQQRMYCLFLSVGQL